MDSQSTDDDAPMVGLGRPLAAVAASVVALLAMAAPVRAEDVTVVAVIGPPARSITTVTPADGGYAVGVDGRTGPGSEWFLTASDGDGVPAVLLSDRSVADRAAGGNA